MPYVPTSTFATSTETAAFKQWLNYFVGYLTLCMTLMLANSAQAQVFTSLQAAGGTLSASSTTFNAGIKGYVQVGHAADAINAVYLYREGSSTPLASKTYLVSYDKLENPVDMQRYFDLSAALPPGTYRLYVNAESENGLSANSQVFTVTVNSNPSIMAAMNAVFALLFDDDATSTTPPGGGSGSGGGAGGSGGAGGVGGSNTTNGSIAAVPLHVAIDPPYLGSADAGSLPGNLSVGKDGTASYGIDLVVPPGSAGMQPKLALNYNSGGGVALAGLGWTLGGISSVHRCAKTMAQDGVNDRITFTAADRLCLDGRRLVRVNGSDPGPDLAARDAAYWDYSAVYRTELESFSRITRWGSGFKVENKDGTTQFYGTTADSAAQAQGRNDSQAMQWMLARLEDRSGNYLIWEYNNNSLAGEVTPKQIRYGGNSVNGQPTDLAVRFDYEARSDIQTAFQGGSHQDIVSRLTSIKTFVDTAGDGSGGSLVRQYQLVYKTSTASGRSLVQSIQASATNPLTGALEPQPETTFEWADSAALPQVVRGAEFTQPNFGSPVSAYPYVGGIREPLSLQASLDGSGRISQVGVMMSACGMYGEPACRGQDVAWHATGLLRIRSPEGVESDVTVDFSPLRDPALPVNLRFASSMVAPGRVEFADVDGDGRDDMLVTDIWANSFTWGSSPIRWGVCLNRGALGAPLAFSCIPGAPFDPYLVELQSDRKMHLVSLFDNQGIGKDCVYSKDAGAFVCKDIKLNSDTPLPFALNPYNVYNFFRPAGVQLGRHSMTDVYSVWTAEVPAADPNNPYRTKLYPENGTAVSKPIDLVQGVTVCFNRPDGLNCKELVRVRSSGKVMTELKASIADDLNADGLTDFAYVIGAPKEFKTLNLGGTTDEINRLAGITGPGTMYVCLSKENGVECKASAKRYAPNADWSDPLETVRSGDFLGDGVTRIMIDTVPNGIDATGAKTELCRYANGEFVCRDMPYLGRQPSKKATGLAAATLDDSGVPVQYVATGNMINGFPGYAPVSLAAPAEQDKLIRVTNGIGHVSEMTYARGNDGSTYGRYVPGGALPMPIYPQMMVQPGVMAKEMRLASGTGNWTKSAFYYEGATVDVAGRDPFGFAKIRITDVANHLTTTSLMALSFPFAGEATVSEMVSGSNVMLNRTTVTLNQKALAFGSGARTSFPFAETTTVVRKDLDGSPISSSVQVDGYDTWGNLKERSEVISGGGKDYTTTLSTNYDNDETSWQLGLARTVTTTKGATGVPNITRTMAYEYDTKGRLYKETVEPGNTALQVEVIHNRTGNSFGLVNTSTQSWIDPYSGTQQSRKLKDVDYDAKGRFVSKARNALGHEQLRTYYSGTGVLKSVTDANQLTASWTVDGFGRTQVTKGPDDNEVRSYAKRCAGSCPLGAVTVSISDRFFGAKRTAAPELAFSDSAGHVLRKVTYGFDGREIVTDFRFDDQGREWQADLPRFANDTAYLAFSKRYDELGRVKEVEGRDDGGAPIYTRTTYRGLNVDIENAITRTETQTRDALGRLVQVNDREGGVSAMSYDAFGNLATTTDPNRNVISIGYDTLGRKTALDDRDLGLTTYSVDPLGRVWKQTSAKQAIANQTAAVKQFTRFEYDLLDRMTGRYETDLESHWQFDTAVKGKGRLAEVYTIAGGLKDYRRIPSYDSRNGRPSTVTQHIDNIRFAYTPVYDDFGRLISQRYVRNEDNSTLKAFDLLYNDRGYLARIENAGRALWTASAQDALGHTTGATLGNGLSESVQYKPSTGRLDNRAARLNGALKVNDTYHYDKLGNVLRREQYWESQQFSETFSYDFLNRLKSSQIGLVTKTFNYDPAGNLRNKTDTGTGDYVYPPQGANSVRPHAVQSIPGIGSFEYDDNGNLKSGGGRILDWTSFNMPKRITKGENYSEFNYGPEHQRTRQFRKDLRIVYAEGQELEINGSNMTIKTYWPTGLGVEIVRPNGSVEDNWFHTDRLGSVIAISDKSGAIKESLAYDAWGKRRTLNGSATPDNLDGLIDNKGYTGHEMLDQLDLVHMNGRVFDPFTARFMSADPHVTNPNDGQNFNRYSYVWNNPLVNTDPTGLDGRGIGWEVYWSAPTYSAGGGADGGAPAEGKQLPNIAMLIREVTSPNSKGSEKSSGTDDRPKPSCDLPLCVEMIGHNPDKPQNTGWRAAIGMTADWTSGHGASYRIYDGSTSSSQNMMQARRVNEARQYFYQKNAEALAAGKPLAPVTNYKGDFGVFDLVWYAGLNPTQQFVGSYRIDISPVGNDQIRFELNNNSSMKSFLYGIGPAWERSSSDTNFGNMRQTYTWTEPIKR